MPPMNHIDDYDSCFQDSDALYCTMKLKVVSDTPNDVMDLIAVRFFSCVLNLNNLAVKGDKQIST